MKVIAIVLASAFALAACGPQTDAQKDAEAAREFCKNPDNKKTDLCALIVNPHR